MNLLCHNCLVIVACVSKQNFVIVHDHSLSVPTLLQYKFCILYSKGNRKFGSTNGNYTFFFSLSLQLAVAPSIFNGHRFFCTFSTSK